MAIQYRVPLSVFFFKVVTDANTTPFFNADFSQMLTTYSELGNTLSQVKERAQCSWVPRLKVLYYYALFLFR